MAAPTCPPVHAPQLGRTQRRAPGCARPSVDPNTTFIATDVGVPPRLGGGSHISPGVARGCGVPQSSQTSAEGYTACAHPYTSRVCAVAGDFCAPTAWWLPRRGRLLLPLWADARSGRNGQFSQLALLGEDSAAPSIPRASLARRLSSSVPPPSPQMERDASSRFFLKTGVTSAHPLCDLGQTPIPLRPAFACAVKPGPGGHKVP